MGIIVVVITAPSPLYSFLPPSSRNEASGSPSLCPARASLVNYAVAFSPSPRVQLAFLTFRILLFPIWWTFVPPGLACDAMLDAVLASLSPPATARLPSADPCSRCRKRPRSRGLAEFFEGFSSPGQQKLRLLSASEVEGRL